MKHRKSWMMPARFSRTVFTFITLKYTIKFSHWRSCFTSASNLTKSNKNRKVFEKIMLEWRKQVTENCEFQIAWQIKILLKFTFLQALFLHVVPTGTFSSPVSENTTVSPYAFFYFMFSILIFSKTQIFSNTEFNHTTFCMPLSPKVYKTKSA